MPSLIERIDNLAASPAALQAMKTSSRKSLNLTDISLWGYGRSSNRDFRMDEYGAAQAVAVVTEIQRAVRFWQQWVGGLEWNIYDGATDTILVSSTDRKPPKGLGAMWFNTLKRFSRNWKHGFFESIAFSDWVYAETYIGKLRNQVQVGDFMWLNPLATEPYIMAGEIEGYWYQSDNPDYPYRLEPGSVAYRIAQRNPHDDWRGSSPVLTAINDINIVENAKLSILNYYRKGMQLGGVVSGKPANEGAWSVDGNTLDEVREQMVRGHKGVQNAFEWFFSNAPVDVNQFQAVDIGKNYGIIEPIRKQIAMAMGVPPVLSGDPTEVNYDNADKVMDNWRQTDGIPYASQVVDFVNEDLLPAVEPNTDIYFGFDFTPFQIEAPEVVSTDFAAGYIDITVSQKERGYAVDKALEGIYVIAGVPMHRDIIAQIARQIPPQFAQPAPALPAPMSEPGAQAETPVAPVAAPSATPLLDMLDSDKAVKAEEQSALCYIPLPNNPDVLRIQKALKERLSDNRIKWEAANTLHVTLCYADGVTDEAITAIGNQIAMRDFEIQATQGEELAYFDTPDGKALHIAVLRTTNLGELQSSVFDAFSNTDATLSKFSNPKDYNPHITLAYLPKDIDFKIQDYQEIADSASNFVIPVSRVVIGRDNYKPVLSISANQVRQIDRAKFLSADDPLSDDLRTWQKIAMKRYKAGDVSKAAMFESASIPPILNAAISGALQIVSTPDEIYTVFDDADAWVRHDARTH